MKKVLIAVLVLSLFITPVFAADIRDIEISIQEMLIQNANEPRRYTNEWSDETIALQMRLSWYGVLLHVVNKSSSIAHLSWDKSAFILTNGQSRRMIPGSTRVIHSGLSVPSSIIPPRASFETITFVEGFGLPPDHDMTKMILDYPVEYSWGRWTGIKNRQSKQYARFADQYRGQKLTMLLCFNIDEQDRYYQFNLNLDFAEGIKNLPLIDDDGNEIKRLSIGWELEENRVIGVGKGSLAEKVGLLEGDLITEINLAPVDTVKNIDSYCLEKLEVGSSVMLLCDRSGETVLITLKKVQ